MLEPLTKILKAYKNKGCHITTIIKELSESDIFIANIPSSELRTIVKDILDEHSKKGGVFERVKKPNGGVKSGYYKIRQGNTTPIAPKPVDNPIDITDDTTDNITNSTQFFGKAGEYAVMAELLFRDFNANNMTVDEGIDIIASKGNNFYFVQVKTTTLKANKTAVTSIQKKNFDRFINQQMRYVICVRYDKGYKFFTLSNSAIEQLRYYNAISISEKTGNISIKIRFDDKMQYPVFYDKSEADASFYEGFKRIEV